MKYILSTTFLILAVHTIFAQSKPSTMTNKVRNISISINKPASEVYQFTSNPENFPKWVAFIKSVSKEGDIWLGKSDLGDIKIKWSPLNEFGILDHHVTLPNGETVYNPMRIISNNKGSEFIFTLFWIPGRTEKEFNEDAQSVTKDLQKLKEKLWNRGMGLI